jgi:carbon-monoxide dehydrogenase medium subunit
MKPAPFSYDRPATLTDAIAVLSEFGDEAKVLAGGQSLVPLLALRFARPARLVDVTGIPGLEGIRPLPDGGVAIGATTRMRALEVDPTIAARVPLAAEAAPFVAHRQIRNRGTVGGSVAHADPAAELPAVMLALGATVLVRGPGGVREIRVSDLYQGVYRTALVPEEILTEIRVPAPPPATGFAFTEIARRRGDFALAGAAAAVTVEAGRCTAASVALVGAADRALAVPQATEPLCGAILDDATARAAGERAAAAAMPRSDVHASSDYRRALVAVLVRRALLRAAERALAAA